MLTRGLYAGRKGWAVLKRVVCYTLQGVVLFEVAAVLILCFGPSDHALLERMRAWRHAWFVQATREAGLVLREIEVMGNRRLTAEEVERVCPLHAGESLWACSPEEVRQAVLALPWVAEATVQRIWPRTLCIRVAERKPVAVWENQGSFFLVDQTGQAFAPASEEEQCRYLVATGPQGARKVPALLKAAERFPTLKKVLQSAVALPGQRWYLVFQPGIYVYMPLELEKGLERLDDLVQRYDLLGREIQGIDLRVEDKLFVYVSADVNTRLQAGRKARHSRSSLARGIQG